MGPLGCARCGEHIEAIFAIRGSYTWQRTLQEEWAKDKLWDLMNSKAGDEAARVAIRQARTGAKLDSFSVYNGTGRVQLIYDCVGVG
jgi:hypothetical protein